MKNLFLLSLLLFPNLDSVFLTTRESSSTPPNWDYLPVLRRFMEEDDLCYGRQKTVFSLDGEDYLYTQVLHEGEYEGYVLSKDDEFVQACLTEKDPVSDYDARYYFDGFLFLDEAKPRSMPERLDVTASGTLGRKGVARRAEEPFYPEHYPSVSSSVTYSMPSPNIIGAMDVLRQPQRCSPHSWIGTARTFPVSTTACSPLRPRYQKISTTHILMMYEFKRQFLSWHKFSRPIAKESLCPLAFQVD